MCVFMCVCVCVCVCEVPATNASQVRVVVIKVILWAISNEIKNILLMTVIFQGVCWNWVRWPALKILASV